MEQQIGDDAKLQRKWKNRRNGEKFSTTYYDIIEKIQSHK